MTGETWLTENTEVRTPTGWANIYDIGLNEEVLCFDGDKIVRDKVRHIAIARNKLTITEYLEKGVRIFGENITRFITFLTPPGNIKETKLQYSGRLFHLRTEKHNNIVVRSFKEYHANNDDYTTLLCRAT